MKHHMSLHILAAVHFIVVSAGCQETPLPTAVASRPLKSSESRPPSRMPRVLPPRDGSTPLENPAVIAIAIAELPWDDSEPPLGGVAAEAVSTRPQESASARDPVMSLILEQLELRMQLRLEKDPGRRSTLESRLREIQTPCRAQSGHPSLQRSSP
jgi:hypothetical protein